MGKAESGYAESFEQTIKTIISDGNYLFIMTR